MTQRSGTDAATPSASAAASDHRVLQAPDRWPNVSVVGAGRWGSVLVRALSSAGLTVDRPHGRGYRGPEPTIDPGIVILCVPDAAIPAAAAQVCPGPLVAHCSGATGLAAIAPHRGFSMHPVMTFTPQTSSDVLLGTPAAIAGTDPEALHIARDLATLLGMQPFIVADRDRVAYHAATAMAANFLVTLESAAGTLMHSAGVDSSVLLPLARAALENWGRQGPAALTGPVARGDHVVVDAHRSAISDRTPALLPLFDALVTATEQLVHPDSHETAPSARTLR